MALFTANFRSDCLKKDTAVTVILPENCPADDIPTLYLLHGMHGSNASWARKTAIERYAANHKIAVVCPDGENSFYHDMKYGEKYFSYVSDELVTYMRKVFRLSDKREKNFIAGLSMGGYGAFRIALLRPDRYAAAASLSGCIHLADRTLNCSWPDIATSIWGEDYIHAVPGSDSDLFHLIDHFPSEAPKPKLYAACGREDSLYESNLTFVSFIRDKGFDFTFEEGEGVHNWDFWDKWIARALDVIL